MKIIIVEDERKSLMGLTALIGQLEERWDTADLQGTAGCGHHGCHDGADGWIGNDGGGEESRQ